MTSENYGDPARSRDWAGAVGSLAFLAVGIYMFVTSFAISPMAAMFPRTIGAIMAGLALLQIAASLTGRSGQAVERGSSLAEQAEGLGRRLTLLATMIAWALLFPVVGMFTTSLVACAILMFTGTFGAITPLRTVTYLGVVFLMVVGFYLVIANVLNVPMPRGWFF